MKVKTYSARSIEAAVEEIKGELGPDALILSTRQTTRRKPWGIRRETRWEVTAGSEAPVPTSPLDQSGLEPGASDSDVSALPLTDSPGRDPLAGSTRPPLEATSPADDRVTPAWAIPREGVTPAWATPPAPDQTPQAQVPHSHARVPSSPARLIQEGEDHMEKVLDEINELKRSVRFLGQALPQLGRGVSNDLFAELVAQRLEPDLARDLVGRAETLCAGPENVRAAVRAMLAELLPTAEPEELMSKDRVVGIFVGPTGVGKTTTVAKLAGQAIARHGKKVVLISTDTQRVTGSEQLMRFAELVGCRFCRCADLESLNAMVQSFEHDDLVLIDTAGCSPSDRVRLGRLQSAVEDLGARVHLVLSATTKPEDIARICKRFQRCAPEGVVVTKVDETETRGAVFGELLRNLMPVTYVSDGQQVPNRLLAPTGRDLARLVLPARLHEPLPQVEPQQRAPKTVRPSSIPTESLT